LFWQTKGIVNLPEVLTTNYADNADNLKPDLLLENKREDCKQKITPKAFRERAKETKILLSLNQKNLRHLRCLLL